MTNAKKMESAPPVVGPDGKPSLDTAVPKVLDMIRERQPSYFETITPELHELPPFVPRVIWNELGDAIKEAESPSTESIPGECWISLRCDGHGFSKLTKRLRKMGILENTGYSKSFAEIMVSCCHALMEFCEGAKCGYTQSDEITILIPPTNKDADGNQQPHNYNGRVQKLVSLAAATVTARFNYEVLKLCTAAEGAQGKALGNAGQNALQIPQAVFDCRVGMYSKKDHAVSLLLWRAYDCGVNGVSDAVHKQRGHIEGAGAMVKGNTQDKLRWLATQDGLLPLADHQRAGTYIVKCKRVVAAFDPKANQDVTCIRSRRIQVGGNVIALWKDDKLFPADETL